MKLSQRDLPLSKRAKGLEIYHKKRKFEGEGKTPEPKGGGKGKNIFTIQLHHAHKAGDHFDLRLQNGDVLESWAVPKHTVPSKNDRFLATQTEPHPLAYAGFHGTISEGYGAGKVEVFQKGHYIPISWTNKKIEFEIPSGKAKGKFVLVNTDGKKWLWMRMKEKNEK